MRHDATGSPDLQLTKYNTLGYAAAAVIVDAEGNVTGIVEDGSSPLSSHVANVLRAAAFSRLKD